jgi:hypothetical protein
MSSCAGFWYLVSEIGEGDPRSSQARHPHNPLAYKALAFVRVPHRRGKPVVLGL